MEIHIGNRVAEIELVSKQDNKVVLTIDGKRLKPMSSWRKTEPATFLWTATVPMPN